MIMKNWSEIGQLKDERVYVPMGMVGVIDM